MKLNWSEKAFWEIRNKVHPLFLKNFVPYNELIENIIKELNLKPGFCILDAGCGPGIFEKKILEKGISNIKIEAIDISNKILQIAKKNNSNSNNISFRVMNLNEKLEIKDRSFDAIVCINVLYLLEKPLYTLLEFYRILKEKGKLVLTVPKYNFNYGILFREHLLKNKGLNTIRDVIVFPLVLGIIFPLELFIALKERRKKYYRFKEEDMIKLFQSTPFQHFKIRDSYTGQNFLIVAEK